MPEDSWPGGWRPATPREGARLVFALSPLGVHVTNLAGVPGQRGAFWGTGGGQLSLLCFASFPLSCPWIDRNHFSDTIQHSGYKPRLWNLTLGLSSISTTYSLCDIRQLYSTSLFFSLPICKARMTIENQLLDFTDSRIPVLTFLKSGWVLKSMACHGLIGIIL